MNTDGNESENAVASAALCMNCGLKPGRPKFCGRSCAAKYNNRNSPKRRPEGRCSRCGQPCPSSRQFCELCRTIAAAEEKKRRQREAENIRQWTTLDGVPAEGPIPRVHVRRKTVFENGRYGELWTLRDPCGPMLDHLMGIIFAQPEYIDPADVPRYSAWVHAFREYTADRPGWQPQPETLPVPKLPLDEIGFGLRHWIESFFSHDNPLMASFALDAADFVVKHAFGDSSSRYGSEHDWELPALVVSERQWRRDAHERIHDKRLKKDITEWLRRGSATVVRGIVPPDGVIVGGDRKASVQPGTPFYFQIDRCHLSESWYDYPQPWEDIYLVEQQREFDIADRFAFPGILLLQRDHPQIEWRRESHLGEWLSKDLDAVADRGVKTYIPARWLTHWIEYGRSDEPRKEHPVAAWSFHSADPGAEVEQKHGCTNNATDLDESVTPTGVSKCE